MPHHPFPTHLRGLRLGRTPAGEWLIRRHDREDWIELGAYGADGADPLTLRDAIRACRKLPSHWSERSPDRPSDTALSAPAFRPGKIVAVAANYAAHAREVGLDTDGDLVLFAKFPTSVIGPTDTIEVIAGTSEQVDYETELAIVIGHTVGPRRKPLPLHQAVFGYTVANDVSARDIQSRGNRLTHAKSLDTFLPLGPWITRPTAELDVDDLTVTTLVNGASRQNDSTALMRRNVAQLVQEISAQITLEPGDLILTGSPAGSATGMSSPEFLNDGDTVVSSVAGLGELHNTVKVLPPGSSWDQAASDDTAATDTALARDSP